MFGSVNAREIHQAVQNLVDPNQWFADAVDARQVSTFTNALSVLFWFQWIQYISFPYVNIYGETPLLVENGYCPNHHNFIILDIFLLLKLFLN